LGGNFFDEWDRQAVEKRLVRRFERLAIRSTSNHALRRDEFRLAWQLFQKKRREILQLLLNTIPRVVASIVRASIPGNMSKMGRKQNIVG
jgi:hypothetical protein